jgi:hypothetical protein
VHLNGMPCDLKPIIEFKKIIIYYLLKTALKHMDLDIKENLLVLLEILQYGLFVRIKSYQLVVKEG